MDEQKMGGNSVETIATTPPSVYAVSIFLVLSLTFHLYFTTYLIFPGH